MVAFSEADSAHVVRLRASHFDITLFHAGRTLVSSPGRMEAIENL
jgi:hypothetical protein